MPATDHAEAQFRQVQYRRAEGATGRRLGDAMFLANLTSDVLFELNETAARVWELAAEGASRSQLADRLR